MRRAWFLALIACPGWAQQTVAPSREPVGSPRGDNVGEYNITQSWELGYRMHEVGGNKGKYRSDVNFGNGVRLLGSRLAINSRDGRGRFFDEILLQTQGLGDDPYEFSNLRIAKNRLYRYDLLWRSNEYFNPALPIVGGRHAMDTVRRLQDHDFTLLPQSNLQFFAGFTRASQRGPALSTGQFFDSFSGGEYLLLNDIDRRQNEFRAGNQFQVKGIKVHWIRAWEQYREDSPFALGQPQSPLPPQESAQLSSFSRTEPYRGTTPSWRVNLFRESGRNWGLNGRFTYSGGRRNFALDEAAVGIDRFGGPRNRQILVAGDGRRPVTTGNLTLTLFPQSDVVLTSHTAFHQIRMEGDSRYTELENAQAQLQNVYFDFLGIRTLTNQTGLQWRLNPFITVRGGYQFAERRIRSRELVAFDGGSAETAAEQKNRLHSGVAGVRLQPLKPLTITLDGELGRHDRPFYPTSERDYHALGARVQYRARGLSLSALGRSYSNFNSANLFSHSAQVRQYSFDAAWAGNGWVSLEAGYSKLQTRTATGLAYFAANQLVSGERSLWLSNLHAGHLGARLAFKQRADLYIGYSHTEDTGDGRRTLDLPPSGSDPGSALPAFREVQTFPVRFLSPLARFSLKLHTNIRFNLGYQYYGYGEILLRDQNYRAHTGFASVLWTF